MATKKCSGADCDKEAGTLQCPTCLKRDIKDVYFCSQDCFKRNWVRLPPLIAHHLHSQATHKVIHGTKDGKASMHHDLV